MNKVSTATEIELNKTIVFILWLVMEQVKFFLGEIFENLASEPSDMIIEPRKCLGQKVGVLLEGFQLFNIVLHYFILSIPFWEFHGRHGRFGLLE